MTLCVLVFLLHVGKKILSLHDLEFLPSLSQLFDLQNDALSDSLGLSRLVYHNDVIMSIIIED